MSSRNHSFRNIKNIVIEAKEQEYNRNGRYNDAGNNYNNLGPYNTISSGNYNNNANRPSIINGNNTGCDTDYINARIQNPNYTSGGIVQGNIGNRMPIANPNFGSLSDLSDIDPRLLEHENPNNCTDFAPGLPLDQYKVNVDNNPRVVRVKKPHEKIRYLQEIAVQYLKPPQGTTRAGDIVIQQGPSKQVAPAPPLVIREPACRPPTPPPMVIRECPPQPPQPFPGKVITIPGKILPPPARKVITEKLPPMPAKPQNILIERWLPYGPQHQRVIFQQSPQTCIVPDPKNLIIEWQNAEVEVQKEFKNLGVREADPRDYLSKYGSSLIRTDQLPDVAVQYSKQAGSQLSSQYTTKDDLILEGDLEALKLIDLDQHGLSYLKGKFGSTGSLNNNWQAPGYTTVGQQPNTYSGYSPRYEDTSYKHGYIPRYEDKNDKNGYSF